MLRRSIEQAGLDPKNLKKKDVINFDQPLDGTKAWRDIWSAGHGVGNLSVIRPVSQIILQLKEEYETAKKTVLHANNLPVK